MRGKVISIARDFSRFPAGRFADDGPYSGQRFRDDILAPALKEANKVTVELDGTLGYGSSFLEEAFGGLVRLCGFAANDLRKRLSLASADSSLETEIWAYIESARLSGRG
ncbi:DUF4325 domain-containing protein [Corallococcus sp. H22C18031201]|nr:DUF4325 domain-containing protein [Corallococcus sp. H22C18031201]